MKWSIRLGRYGGIDVRLHVTFVLFLVFVGATQAAGSGSVLVALRGVGFLVAVFGCVLLHEFGHALMARRFGIRTRDITLLPIGGVARLERMPDRPMQEFWVALAGPAVNVAIAAILVVVLGFSGWVGGWTGRGALQGSMLVQLLWVNLTLVVFNMIPAFPMDGGRVLRSLLALRMDYARATRWAANLGQAIALGFAFFGLMGLWGGVGNPLLLFIALFVWIGASQEAEMAEMRSSTRGAKVRDVMLTHYWTLNPQEPLSRAVELVLAGSQQDFPVVRDGAAVGVLSRRRLLNALARGGRDWPVGAAMDVELPACSAADDLELAMADPRIKALGTVPVVEGGRMVGLLTLDNVAEFVWIRAALRASAGRGSVSPPPLVSI